MLEFWFSSDISRTQKVLILIITLLIAVGLYRYHPLPLDIILMFAGTGIIFLICRYFKQYFAQNNPTGLLYRLLTWIPIALLLTLLFMKTMNNLMWWGIQGIAFMALAVFIFSPQFLFKSNAITPPKEH
ncbi:hypothetical protein D7V21_06515 [Acinetobacter guerrae]|uniref:Uncharacterized protein n=1 Tax=Acinetobacter guerrae TaxID=1843371 RepID=A0A3A8EJW0_9GAMM|nr:hypothetical protein [Acinetobacter guerrae]MPW43458.1 hypothetical protein [Acinetobacter guerrae]RKG34399.1 hypothetical protein D7V21_06515 [Acinetobacter guerrae]